MRKVEVIGCNKTYTGLALSTGNGGNILQNSILNLILSYQSQGSDIFISFSEMKCINPLYTGGLFLLLYVGRVHLSF